MKVPALGLLLVFAVAGCDGTPLPGSTPQGPYVVTAIDYHFHDAHPSDQIDPSRDVVFVNAGRNVHNVTFRGHGFDRDIPPGGRLTLDVGEVLGGPGRYVFTCSYHLDRGMAGELVIR